MEKDDDDHCYVYLEFNEKLTPSIFGKKLFFRVANLHKPNPLVQVNDLVFKGIHDECVGTNIFFEEVEDPPLKTNIFERDPPIHLKPLVSQTKIIKLKKANLPRNITSTKQCKESAVLNLNQDYAAVLEKLEQGVLNIEDVAYRESEPMRAEPREMSYEVGEDDAGEPEREVETLLGHLGDGSASASLEIKYEKLKRLARRPTKRMKSPERIEVCDPQYRDAYEYHNLERQICQPSDAFRSVCSPMVEKSFVGGVDIDRCVLHGFLPSSNDLNREMSREERRKVFTVDNFDNLSIPARYVVMKEYVAQIEDLMENTSSEELKEVDENGRTIKDICDIFRKLLRALERTMSSEEALLEVKVEGNDRRAEDDYVKYRYDPDSELLLESYKSMFKIPEPKVDDLQ